MTSLKWTIVCLLALMATAVSSAQQKFPLRSGEWATTTPSSIPNRPPTTLLYCLNDELWTKALTKMTSCSINQLNVTLTGASYILDCPMKAVQMKGKVVMSFDGMTHMISKGSFDMTMDGKVTHSESQTDYRWKGSTCNPNADMNLNYSHLH
ncbi:MAG: hypothetical protein WBQ94_16970 [Terracidiphilus sp.]